MRLIKTADANLVVIDRFIRGLTAEQMDGDYRAIVSLFLRSGGAFATWLGQESLDKLLAAADGEDDLANTLRDMGSGFYIYVFMDGLGSLTNVEIDAMIEHELTHVREGHVAMIDASVTGENGGEVKMIDNLEHELLADAGAADKYGKEVYRSALLKVLKDMSAQRSFADIVRKRAPADIDEQTLQLRLFREYITNESIVRRFDALV